MRRLLVVLFVAAGVLVVAPGRALACDCASTGVAALVASADSVGTGSVEWVAIGPNQTAHLVVFDRVYKGSLAEREKVYTADRDTCRAGPLAEDRRYLFYLDGLHRGRLTFTGCLTPSPATEKVITAVERARGPGTEPVAVPTVIDRDEPAATAWWWTWVVGLTAIAIVAMLVWLGRRRLRRTPGELDARTPHR